MLVVDAVLKGDRVAVKSGQKTGKTMVAAFLVWYWLLFRPRAQVYVTGASARTIKDGVWKEIRWLLANARVPFFKGVVPIQPSTGFSIDEHRHCVGISTDTPDNLAGKSGSEQLWIIDEASGFDESFWDPVLGNLIGGGKVLALSNPIRLTGRFREIFTDRSDFWEKITLRSNETPNYITGNNVVAGLASREYVDQLLQKYGPDSLICQTRIFGNFPRQGSDTVITIDLLEQSKDRWQTASADGQLRVGIDPARGGSDESVISFVRGNKHIAQRYYQGLEGDELAARAKQDIAEFLKPGEIADVRVDINGLGTSPYDFLKYEPSLNVTGLMVTQNANNPKYYRRRDELWFDLRDWMRAGGAILDDPDLHAELLTATYSFAGPKLKVADKDTMKKTLRRSPDRADALALAVYDIPVPVVDLSVITFTSERYFGRN